MVLVRRRFEPLAGQWSLPGGALEVGETLEAGVAREMLEETGLIVEVGGVIEVFDRIMLDDDAPTGVDPGARAAGSSSLRAHRLSVPAHGRDAAGRLGRCGVQSSRILDGLAQYPRDGEGRGSRRVARWR